MDQLIEKSFNLTLKYFDPTDRFGENPEKAIFKDFTEMVDNFMGIEKNNFVGGCNDNRRTKHESIFKMLKPNLEEQVSFGTGEGGYKKYGVKRYIADFYDRNNNLIYEIDGRNHSDELQILKDKIRDYFFLHDLNIKTIRLSNDEVEKILKRRLEKIYKTNPLTLKKIINNFERGEIIAYWY